jgi:hypothetical protein
VDGLLLQQELPTELTLGRYAALKLVDARELAREAPRTGAHGGDPVIEKRAAREVPTFGQLANEHMERYSEAEQTELAGERDNGPIL